MKKNRVLIAILVTILIIIIIPIIYVSNYYKAQKIENYLKSNNQVKVIKKDNYYYFDGKGQETAFIFYPGGKVESTSYAPLLNKLASSGIDCFLVNMPFNLPILNKDAAEKIIENNNYNNWYIGGHSLGGVTSSLYKNKLIDGYIFLASYPTTNMNKRVLLIRGDQDGVLKLKGYNESKDNWGKDYKEVIIKGGNHSNFGNYGLQKKDNKSTISREKQQEQTNNEIINYINMIK